MAFSAAARDRACEWRPARGDGRQRLFCRRPSNCKRTLARFPQQVHERVQDLQHDAIFRRLGYGVMELRIFVDGQLAPVHFFFLPAQNLFHVGQFFGGSILGGASGERGFDHAAKFEQIADEFALPKKHGSQRIDQGFGRRIANHSAFALAGLDQAHQFQRANGIAQRAAADLQHFRQFAFWGQFFAGLNEAVADHALELLRGLFVDLCSADDFEFVFS